MHKQISTFTLMYGWLMFVSLPLAINKVIPEDSVWWLLIIGTPVIVLILGFVGRIVFIAIGTLLLLNREQQSRRFR